MYSWPSECVRGGGRGGGVGRGKGRTKHGKAKEQVEVFRSSDPRRLVSPVLLDVLIFLLFLLMLLAS